MAPHQRCDTYAVSQPATGNTSADERNPRSAGEPGEFPEAPDAPDADAVIEASFTKVLLEWTRSRDEGGSARTRPTSRRQ